MIISILVAIDENGGIGLQGRLPWRQSADLKRFKALTMGHHLIMGRKTYESIGRPLPGRPNLVISHNLGYHPPGVQVVHSLEEALRVAEAAGESECFVIGGGQIFTLAIPLADRLYLTQVHSRGPADTFFPDLSEEQWRLKESQSHPADEKNEHPVTFTLLERRQYLDKSSL
jgi:dihydrofolate reductase